VRVSCMSLKTKVDVTTPELPRAGQQELEPQDTWRPRSCPGLGSGSWSRRTHGGPRAAPGWAAGDGAVGHVVAPELPRRVPSGFRQFGLKTGGDGFSRFVLKTGGRVSWLSLKTKVTRVSRFGPQNWQLWFYDLGLKITATVSWFGPQNHVGFGLSVAPQNRRREVGARHASKSSSLLGIQASLTRVSQSGLKTGGGATTGGASGTIAEVASEASCSWMGRCDRLRRTLLSLLCRFFFYLAPGA
jgi:hypothetical protein